MINKIQHKYYNWKLKRLVETNKFKDDFINSPEVGKGPYSPIGLKYKTIVSGQSAEEKGEGECYSYLATSPREAYIRYMHGIRSCDCIRFLSRWFGGFSSEGVIFWRSYPFIKEHNGLYYIYSRFFTLDEGCEMWEDMARLAGFKKMSAEAFVQRMTKGDFDDYLHKIKESTGMNKYYESVDK